MPGEYILQMGGVQAKTGQPWEIDVGYERFLAPEIFFQPEIYSSEYVTPLPELVVGFKDGQARGQRFFCFFFKPCFVPLKLLAHFFPTHTSESTASFNHRAEAPSDAR